MTPAEAEALAAATLAAIDAGLDVWGRPWQWLVADRERVAADLAGLRDCYETHMPGYERVKPGHFPHRARYADNLRRTAALYGVTT